MGFCVCICSYCILFKLSIIMNRNIFLIILLAACNIAFGQNQNHWTPDENVYTNTMSLISVVAFDGVEQQNAKLEVGVFCNDELRGSQIAQLIPDFSRYYFFLTIYGNNGDVLTFKLYDHETQKELDYATESKLVFETNGGEEYDMGNPFVINFNASQGNHWNADENLYDATMSVVAIATVNNDELREDYYEIGVFCNDEVRGSERLSYVPDFDRYFAFLTVYGKDNDVLTFKIYDHQSQEELDYETETTLTFVSDGVVEITDPLVIDFISQIKIYTFDGEGSWSDVNNWRHNKKPTLATDNVVIIGNAFLEEEVTINTLVINKNGKLNINEGGNLTVTNEITNNDTNALVINDGGQLYCANDVYATFRKNIVNPQGVWGDPDKTGWQFISSPMQNSLVSDFVPENGDYDLYKYVPTSTNYQWYNYKKATTYNFDNDAQGWTSIDADGDGYCWMLQYGGFNSYSYEEGSEESLTPDNYLVSPKINVEEGMLFCFSAESVDENYPEFCGVAVSSDGETFQMIEEGWEIKDPVRKSVSLNDYIGEEIYVAIRHYNVENQYCLMIDDVEINRLGASLETGIAYLASYNNETTAEFKGVLNKENAYTIDANYSGTYNMANFTLVGNPFSYNINWETDVKTNGISEGYAIIGEDGAYKYHDNGIVKVGEGFMIYSTRGRSHNITFQKGINASKRNTDNNSVNIIATGKFGTDNVILNFNGNETSGFPKLMNFNDRIANVYVKENDTVFAIFNYSEGVNEIPLYFDAKEMGTYTLTFDLEGNYDNLYLLDKMKGEKVNVLLENEYSFTATSNDNPERFVLLKDNSQQSTDNRHFAYINNGDIVISDIEGDAQIRIIDALGRCVCNNECSDEIHRVDAASHVLTSGIYMIQKIDDKGIKVQKLIL